MIQLEVKTRSATQIRSHAQKLFKKLKKKNSIPLSETTSTNKENNYIDNARSGKLLFKIETEDFSCISLKEDLSISPKQSFNFNEESLQMQLEDANINSIFIDNYKRFFKLIYCNKDDSAVHYLYIFRAMALKIFQKQLREDDSKILKASIKLINNRLKRIGCKSFYQSVKNVIEQKNNNPSDYLNMYTKKKSRAIFSHHDLSVQSFLPNRKYQKAVNKLHQLCKFS